MYPKGAKCGFSAIFIFFLFQLGFHLRDAYEAVRFVKRKYTGVLQDRKLLPGCSGWLSRISLGLGLFLALIDLHCVIFRRHFSVSIVARRFTIVD